MATNSARSQLPDSQVRSCLLRYFRGLPTGQSPPRLLGAVAHRRESRVAHDYRELAAIFAGGGLGTLSRVALDTVIVRDPHHWPWPTFTVNIVGALLVGYFTTRLLERLPVSSYRAAHARHWILWRVNHFLDGAGRDREDGRIWPLGPGRGLHRHQHHVGNVGGAAGHEIGAPATGTRMTAAAATTALIWVGVALLGGIGRCCVS